MKHPTVLNVGIYDSDKTTLTKDCPYYAVWHAMLVRVYCQKFRASNPSYAGCSVHPDWHLFSNFKSWMVLQDWEGKCLDKDLLVPGNRIYGPDTCLFVSKKVNSLLTKQPRRKGIYPLGVHPWGSRYKASMRKNMKTHHIGVFDSPEEAHAAYCLEKAEWVESVAALETCAKTKKVLLREAALLRSIP